MRAGQNTEITFLYRKIHYTPVDCILTLETYPQKILAADISRGRKYVYEVGNLPSKDLDIRHE